MSPTSPCQKEPYITHESASHYPHVYPPRDLLTHLLRVATGVTTCVANAFFFSLSQSAAGDVSSLVAVGMIAYLTQVSCS